MRDGPSCSIEQASNGGHTATLRTPPPATKSKGGMEMYNPGKSETRVYSKGDHAKMLSDIQKHLGLSQGLGAKKAAPMVKTAPSKAAGMAKAMASAPAPM